MVFQATSALNGGSILCPTFLCDYNRCGPHSWIDTMFRQYYAQRFRSMYPTIPRQVGRKTVYYADPRDRQIGTIPVGTILYIQDGVRPLNGLTRDIVRREPWIVEAWLPRDYAK